MKPKPFAAVKTLDSIKIFHTNIRDPRPGTNFQHLFFYHLGLTKIRQSQGNRT